MKSLIFELKVGSLEEEIYYDIWSSIFEERVIAGFKCDPPKNGWGSDVVISDDKEYVKIYRDMNRHLWCVETSSYEFVENVLTILAIALL